MAGAAGTRRRARDPGLVATSAPRRRPLAALDTAFPYVAKRPVPATVVGWSRTAPRGRSVSSASRAVTAGSRVLVLASPAAARGTGTAILRIERSGILLVGDEIRRGSRTIAVVTGFRERRHLPALIVGATMASGAAEPAVGAELRIVMPSRPRSGGASSPPVRPAAHRR